MWIVDSTPVECGRSWETVKRSELAGWAQYGYCASHSRFFWGLRLHLVCTLQGLPVAFALTGAKADERATLLDLLAAEPHLLAARPGQTLIGDKHYFGRAFEQELAQQGVQLLRPTREGERQRPGGTLFKPLRQVIETVNETFKGQLDLEQHRARTPGGVIARVMQRILALTAVIWHNDHTARDTLRSLTPYDHDPLEPIILERKLHWPERAASMTAVERGLVIADDLAAVRTRPPVRCRRRPRPGRRSRSWRPGRRRTRSPWGRGSRSRRGRPSWSGW